MPFVTAFQTLFLFLFITRQASQNSTVNELWSWSPVALEKILGGFTKMNLAKKPSFFCQRTTEQRENPVTNNRHFGPDAAWPVLKASAAMPMLSADILISPLGTIPLQNTYYSKTKWTGLSRKASCWRKSHLVALWNPAIVLEQLQWVRADLNVLSASMVLPVFCRKESSLWEVCISFNKLLKCCSPLLSIPPDQV